MRQRSVRRTTFAARRKGAALIRGAQEARRTAPNSATCHAACAATPIPGPSCRISTRTGPASQRAAAGLFQRELRSTNCNLCAIGTYSSHGQPGAALARRGIAALAPTASDRCLLPIDAAWAPTGQWETAALQRRAFPPFAEGAGRVGSGWLRRVHAVPDGVVPAERVQHVLLQLHRGLLHWEAR